MAKAVCSNLPTNVVGPFDHTLFLGLSVQSFSSSMGWNEQESSIQVELAEDKCKPTNNPKVYYPAPGIKRFWDGPDPGFQTPTIGAPVYFRAGDFEFAGIIQSWNKNQGSDGNPTYSVTITDPRFLLQNLTVIASDYAGSVENIYNLINAYGYLESIGPVCPQETINGAIFGSPAGGFGGAKNNDTGTPWSLLKQAIQVLLSGSSHAKYSPFGHAVYRGHTPQNIPAPANNMGRLSPDSFSSQIIQDFNGNGYTSNYFVDISEIPFSPTYYRINSPSISLLDLISQVCSDAGCDYFVELIITTSLEKVIKIRTVKRRAQPTLGQIDAFIEEQNDLTTTKQVGRELRNEPTSVFLYGSNVQTLFETKDPTPTGSIIQHWGFDVSGNLRPATFVSGTGLGQDQWHVTLDLLNLQAALDTPLTSGTGLATTAIVTEDEMRMAMGGFNSWFGYALYYGATGSGADPNNSSFGTDIGKIIKGDHTGLQNPLGGRGSKLLNQFGDIKVDDNGQPMVAMGPLAQQGHEGASELQNIESKKKVKKDLERIHDFIKGIGDEFCGKKFLVKLPFVCLFDDPDSKQKIYSDTPSSDGGYPASGITGVLDLPFPSTGIDFFSDESNKVEAFVVYHTGIAGGSKLVPNGDYITHQTGLYAKASVDTKIVPYPSGGNPTGIPTVILTVSSPLQLEKSSRQIDGMKTLEDVAVPQDQKLPDNIKEEGDAFGFMLKRAAAKAPKCYAPSGAIIPMLSHTTRYGPWGFRGPPGPVKFETDDSLAPWEYGGYDVLSSGALEKASDGLTFMQVGERGSFSIAGYPIKQLGQDLRSIIPSFSNNSLEQAVTSVGTYYFISTEAMDGSLGPNITSINTDIGDGGVTTTYQLATFTPSFGRLAKLNAERIKSVGKERVKQQRQARENLKLKQVIKNVKEAIKDLNKKPIDEPVQKKSKPKDIIVAAKDTFPSGTESGLDITSSAMMDSESKGYSSNNQSGQWSKTAMMSTDGYLRPVSKSGDGGLPQYANKASSACALTSGVQRQGDPPVNQWVRPNVNVDYLDPLASTGDPKHADNPNHEDFHHDISVAGFGSEMPSGEEGTFNLHEYGFRTKATGQKKFPSDFRFMALRGPLVIHGWGYDLDGKPIPNKADSEASARTGSFLSVGLEDKFLDKWLRKPSTWPVAPVDLRFDRERGVWTVPQGFRIIQAKADVSISAGSLGDATPLNISTVFDGGGGTVGSPKITVKVPSWQQSISINESFFAFYDTKDCVYYPIGTGLGGGSGGGNGINVFRDAGCFNTLAFGTECFDETGCMGKTTTLVAGTGLRASNTTVSAPSSDCNGSAVRLDLRIPVLDDDDPPSTVSGITGCTPDWGAIYFGSGLNVSTGNTNDCDYLYIDAEADSGIYVYRQEDCTTIGCGSSASSCVGKLNTLVAGRGLNAASSSISATGSCLNSNVIKLDLKIPMLDEDEPPSSISSASCVTDWDLIYFGSGLSLNSGTTGNCNFLYLKTSDTGGGGVQIKDAGYCAYSPSVSSCTDASCITFGSGLRVVSEGGSNYKVNVGGLTVDSNNYIEDIDLGCGLTSVAGACGNVTLKVDGGTGSATGIKVVRDICCSGDTLDIRYMTLNFSECGIFTGTGTGTDPAC